MAKVLDKLFKEFNKKYFGGRLPKYRVIYVKGFPSSTQSGECDPKTYIIKISRELRQFACEPKMVLLHEMVHAKLLDGKDLFKEAMRGFHGKAFQKEMLRLVKRGAFKGIW